MYVSWLDGVLADSRGVDRFVKNSMKLEQMWRMMNAVSEVSSDTEEEDPVVAEEDETEISSGGPTGLF